MKQFVEIAPVLLKSTLFASLVGLALSACAGADEYALDSEEGDEMVVQTVEQPQKKRPSVKSDCTINLCNGLKQPGSFQCHFGVCMCVAPGITAECKGSDQCKETGCISEPVLKNPFLKRR